MGYKIIYGKPEKPRRSILLLPSLISLFLIAFSVILRLSRPEIVEALGQFLASDELGREVAAVTAMVQEWVQWEAVSDAVEVFCQELLGGE